jgi:Homeodomain-like domain-containing protein
MPRGPHPIPITLTDDERMKLADWSRRPTTAQRLALRANIVLAAAEGRPTATIAANLHLTAPTVRKWRSRFAASRLEGLADEPRPGAPRPSATLRSRPLSPGPWNPGRPTPPTGAHARWPATSACRRRQSAGSGAPSG